MGLHGSELGIDNSDSSGLSYPSNSFLPSKSEYQSENGEGTDMANSMAEDSATKEGEDEDEEGEDEYEDVDEEEDGMDGDEDIDEEEEGMDEEDYDVDGDEEDDDNLGEEDDDVDEEDDVVDEGQEQTYNYEPPKEGEEGETKRLGVSRAELRKMQEELVYQEGDIEHPNQMDLRLGRIINIVQDDADELLYISEIYLGEYDETRLVSTSLKEHYPERSDLMNRLVVILCNINPMDDREIKSKTGMLLLSTKTKFNEKGDEIGEYAELVGPTHCDKEGARIYVDGYSMDKPQPPRDEEYFDFVMKDFLVDTAGHVVWRGLPLKIEGCPLSNVAASRINDTFCRLD